MILLSHLPSKERGPGRWYVVKSARRGDRKEEEDEGLLVLRVGLEHAHHSVGVPGEAGEGGEERGRHRTGVDAEDGSSVATDIHFLR
jgi:hypothetical protein